MEYCNWIGGRCKCKKIFLSTKYKGKYTAVLLYKF